MKRVSLLAVSALFFLVLGTGCGEDPGAAVPPGLTAGQAPAGGAAAPAAPAAAVKGKGVSGLAPVGPAD